MRLAFQDQLVLTEGMQRNHDCQLCDQQNLSIMLNRALYDRYLTNIDFYYLSPIEDFVNEEITSETCKFRQQVFQADDDQQLRRQYKQQQFKGKIQALSQYYKFHRDLPRMFQKNTFKTMGRYYDRLRNYDYKKIKNALKEEQGISLTTQKSDSSFENSSIQIKSRYSDVLGGLDENSQSQSKILSEICTKIGKAFSHIPAKRQFKGQYFSGQKKFQEYLLSLKCHKNNVKFIKNPIQNSQGRRNYNLYKRPSQVQPLSQLNLKIERNQASRKKISKKKNEQEIQMNKNMLLKESLKNFKRSKNRNVKSIQKTTANETISRQDKQKSKRFEKLQKTLELQIEKNSNQMFKPLSTGLIALKSNTMLKTLDQIYKPSIEKYHSDKTRKGATQPIHNLNKIYENKLSSRKSNSKIKSKVTSIHNSKEINNFKEFMQKGETERSNKQQHKTLQTRNSSVKRLSRSKSTLKTGNSVNRKSSQKQFKTIQHDQMRATGQQEKSGKKSITHDNRQSIHMRKPLKNFSLKQIATAPRQSSIIKRSKSRQSLHQSACKRQASKERTSSVKKLHSTQKIQRSASKSKLNSARNNKNDSLVHKFKSADPSANIEKVLQKKLTMIQRTKPKGKKKIQ